MSRTQGGKRPPPATPDPAAWLAGLAGTIEWGTGRTARMLARLGDPHLWFRVVHVGGTNGKGSVSALIGASLARRRRAGVFLSPALLSPADCVWIDGRPVAPDVFAAALERVRPVAQAEGATAFEALVAVAFEAFRLADVEVAVVEVGMGGADDATSVVRPDVVVVTNVALDHVRELGSDVASIARVKAGLIRGGAPAATAAEGDALAVLRSRAAEQGVELAEVRAADVRVTEVSLAGTRFGLHTADGREEPFRLRLVGRRQALNAAVAVRALGLLPGELRPTVEEAREGMASVRLPGRFSVVRDGGVCWILDVAHNPDGVRALADTLREVEPARPLVVVASILADKDWRAMLDVLDGFADALVVTTAPSAPAARCWALAEVAAHAGSRPWRVVEALAAAVDLAPSLLPAASAGEPRGTVLVTGSFVTVADAIRHHAPLGQALDAIFDTSDVVDARSDRPSSGFGG